MRRCPTPPPSPSMRPATGAMRRARVEPADERLRQNSTPAQPRRCGWPGGGRRPESGPKARDTTRLGWHPRLLRTSPRCGRPVAHLRLLGGRDGDRNPAWSRRSRARRRAPQPAAGGITRGPHAEAWVEHEEPGDGGGSRHLVVRDSVAVSEGAQDVAVRVAAHRATVKVIPPGDSSSWTNFRLLLFGRVAQRSTCATTRCSSQGARLIVSPFTEFRLFALHDVRYPRPSAPRSIRVRCGVRRRDPYGHCAVNQDDEAAVNRAAQARCAACGRGRARGTGRCT